MVSKVTRRKLKRDAPIRLIGVKKKKIIELGWLTRPRDCISLKVGSRSRNTTRDRYLQSIKSRRSLVVFGAGIPRAVRNLVRVSSFNRAEQSLRAIHGRKKRRGGIEEGGGQERNGGDDLSPSFCSPLAYIHVVRLSIPSAILVCKVF